MEQEGTKRNPLTWVSEIVLICDLPMKIQIPNQPKLEREGSDEKREREVFFFLN